MDSIVVITEPNDKMGDVDGYIQDTGFHENTNKRSELTFIAAVLIFTQTFPNSPYQETWLTRSIARFSAAIRKLTRTVYMQYYGRPQQRNKGNARTNNHIDTRPLVWSKIWMVNMLEHQDYLQDHAAETDKPKDGWEQHKFPSFHEGHP
ncbi:hypothetical protein AGABI2DRAFT_113651 [Agaricus bisporus var. bisporus H97]|uniref:hypothetical protein n=1 Tax=Agaricus bisporus var. bisporus (strain H97 / ATCC MYA-4626 / FGSC 10389) TaxID=936046 RepID=UPI00029F72C0|nr:hypothetical protein AGABI2DRAFT_113651 [Agaricus bisporus var. bisporus H97]EKV50909.1 hypothetical protein AGABI2DRAFT_113651 [Agaricus bisporus var. bisporus H97]